MAVTFLRRKWRNQKPDQTAEINWAVAPPSLVVAFPLNDRAGAPFDYVTRIRARENTTRGFRTWEPYGLSYGGGGVVFNGSAVTKPVETAPFNHRRAIAWRQRNMMHLYYGPANAVTTFFGGSVSEGTVLHIRSPAVVQQDPQIGVVTWSETFIANANSSLLTTWHSLMISLSTGQNPVEPQAGFRAWDDGTLIGSQNTYSGGPPFPAINTDVPILAGMAPGYNGLAADIEYWYEFDDFVLTNDLAGQLHENPYYFFRAPLYRVFSLPAPPAAVQALGTRASVWVG